MRDRSYCSHIIPLSLLVSTADADLTKVSYIATLRTASSISLVEGICNVTPANTVKSFSVSSAPNSLLNSDIRL